jgi:hypothetical protein
MIAFLIGLAVSIVAYLVGMCHGKMSAFLKVNEMLDHK